MEKKKRIYPHRPYNAVANLSKITEEQKEKVKAMYLDGFPQTKIEETLKMTRKTIRTILQQSGLLRDKSSQLRLRWGSSLNENVLDVLTPNACYWIGFLYADGHVRKEGAEYSIEVEIELKDKQHLIKLAQFFECNKEPKQYSENSCTIRFYSKKLQEKLRELGLTHDKSYTAKPNDLLKDSRDFWRGVIDGDGGIYNYKEKSYNASKHVHLCGTLATIEGFIMYCSAKLGVKEKSATHKPGKALYSISYYGVEAEQILNLLYKDATVYLDRKYKTYLEVCQENK
jgi:hypothetical protein